MDFVRPVRSCRLQLVSGRGHYETVIKAVREARCSVWIATANIKVMVDDDRWSSQRRRKAGSSYRSVIEVFDKLVTKGVALRILHAATPSGPFRAELRRHAALLPVKTRTVSAGAAFADPPFEMRPCPRVHAKIVAVDGRFLYLGSANWTGAGLGAKGTGRRNFELGLVTDDEMLLDDAQEMFDRIWRGAECAQCKLTSVCPAPLSRPRPAPPPLPRAPKAVARRRT